MIVTEPGVYDIPEADYHTDPVPYGSLSSTVARKLLPPSCPALARYAVDNPEHKDAYDLGSVTHQMILGSGPELVEVETEIWTPKAKVERDAARERGAVALKSKDMRAAERMRDAVYSHPLAHAVLSLPGAPERTLIWREDDVWCRAMLDRWPDPAAGEPIVGDLKTTAGGTSDDALSKAVANYGYHQQDDWYSRGYYAVHGVWPRFMFVFVEKDPPHLVRVVELDEDTKRRAAARNDAALGVWAECRRTGIWPGRPLDVALIGLPRWAATSDDNTDLTVNTRESA